MRAKKKLFDRNAAYRISTTNLVLMLRTKKPGTIIPVDPKIVKPYALRTTIFFGRF